MKVAVALSEGVIRKLAAAMRNGGLVTMAFRPGTFTGQHNRRRKHNERLEKWGYLIEIRGQWFVTPKGEDQVRAFYAAQEARKK